MYINGLQRFSMPYSRVAYRLSAWSCVRLRRRRISLHDSTNITIFGEKSKREDSWRCGRIFIVKLSIIRIVNIMH